MKILILTVLVASAMSMELDLNSMLGGLNLDKMLGGLNLDKVGGIGGILGHAKDILGNVNLEDITAMAKDIEPEQMKAILNNAPPQLMEMVQGLGISKEDISEIAEHMPEHLEEIKGMVGNGDMTKMLKSEIAEMGLPVPEGEDMTQMMENVKTFAREHLQEFGLDMEDLKDIKNAIPKVMQVLKNKLKETGLDVDFETPEEMRQQVGDLMMEYFGIDKDFSDEEKRQKVMDKMKGIMAELGMEIDLEHPDQLMDTLKDQLINGAKGFGIEIKDGADLSEIKETFMQKLKESGVMSNPMQYLPMVMSALKGGLGGLFGMSDDNEEMPQMMPQMMPHQMPQQMPPHMMMAPPQQQMMMQRPPMQMPVPMNLNLEINIDGNDAAASKPPHVVPAYLRGAEDALAHAYGDDKEVVRHVMTVQQGVARGVVSEEAVHELLQDLMHFRLQARVLATRNQMLEQELMHRRFESRIPMTQSPFLNHIRNKWNQGQTNIE